MVKKTFYTDLHKYNSRSMLDGKFEKYNTTKYIVSQDDQMTLVKTIKIFDFIFLK